MASENPSLIKNIIAIVGFILLLGIGIWSAIQVIQFVPRLFSDTGVQTNTTTDNGLATGEIVAQLSADTAQSGQPVTLTWAHGGNDTGITSFAYACVEGFYFQIAGRPVPCNAPYNVDATQTSLEITPLAAKERVEAPLAITYTNTDGESIRDTKTLIVLNDSLATDTTDTTGTTTDTGKGPVEPSQPTTTNKPTTPTNPQPVVQTIRVPVQSNPYGSIDLKVEMIAIGEVNPYGTFEQKSIVHQYALGAVKFKVTNLGDRESGTWFYNAILPTRGGYPFSSGPQQSLMPGASTEVFVTFDQLIPGVHTFSVHVDPLNYIPELAEFNNTTAQALSVLNY